MSHISNELSLVFDKACAIYYGDCKKEIDCMNLLLSMATVGYSYSAEILSRFGFTETVAKSFIADNEFNENRFITDNAERIIKRAEEIAESYGYNTTCSHHLLLAVVENNNPIISQILLDYGLTKIRITEIVEAMCYNGIGKNISNNGEYKGIKLNKGMKNKELENEILSALRKNSLSDN